MGNYLKKNQVEQIAANFFKEAREEENRKAKEQKKNLANDCDSLPEGCKPVFTADIPWVESKELFFKYVLSYTTLPDFMETKTEDDKITYVVRFLTGFMMNFGVSDYMLEHADLFSVPKHFQEYRSKFGQIVGPLKDLVYGGLLADINEDFKECKESRLIGILEDTIFEKEKI